MINFFKNLFKKEDDTAIVSGPSGKTMRLIEAASKDKNACVVCANAADAKKLENIISKNNWSIKIMTFNQFVNKEFRNTDIKSFYFDDVDKMFKGVVHPKKVKMLSFNSDNVIHVMSSNED